MISTNQFRGCSCNGKRKMAKKKEKQEPITHESILVGTVMLNGYILTKIYAVEDCGDMGNGDFTEEGVVINISLSPNDYADVYDTLFHELTELWLMVNHKRYVDSLSDGRYDYRDCIFVLNHNDFQSMIENSSKIAYEVEPKLRTIWNKYHKNKENK